MRLSKLRKTFSVLIVMALIILIFKFIKWQSSTPIMNLPDIVWAKCLLKEQCTIPLSEYRTDLDWDTLCYQTFEKTANGVPCDYCNIITLQKDNAQVYQKRIIFPHKEDDFIVHFEEQNDQCYSRKSTKILASKTHQFGYVNYGVNFVPLSQ